MISKCDALSSTLNNVRPPCFPLDEYWPSLVLFIEMCLFGVTGQKSYCFELEQTCYLPTASSDARLLSCRSFVREGPLK